VTIDVREVTDPGSPDFAALLGVWQAVDAEISPGDPPIPAPELAADLFAAPPDFRHRAWLATGDGVAVGAATYEQQLDGANDGEVEVYAITHPAHRRSGVARALAGPALDGLAAAGARSVLGWVVDGAGAAFCQSLGMTHRQDERCSRLRLADVDDALLRGWIDDAPARAAGYRLVGWSGVAPDEWAGLVATALDAMVDAPIDDLDWDPQPVSADQHAGHERWWDRRGYDVVTTLALAPDGSPAGVTQLLTSRLRPALGEQADTGVLAAHRGHALGRWLKAENLRRAREHQPGLEVVQTWNAESNPWMLEINVAMGFRPHIAYASYQGPLAGAREALDRRHHLAAVRRLNPPIACRLSARRPGRWRRRWPRSWR
jgi:GNAT superfamily N-acetyltransferase